MTYKQLFTDNIKYSIDGVYVLRTYAVKAKSNGNVFLQEVRNSKPCGQIEYVSKASFELGYTEVSKSLTV